MYKSLTKAQEEAINYIKSLNKNELLYYVEKWNNGKQNPNWGAMQNWTKQELARCIITDIRLSR